MSDHRKIAGGASKLARLFAQNLETPKRCEISAEGSEATVYVYDVIDEYFGIGGQEFAEQIARIDADVINLRVDSPGGSVFAARAMQTALRQHKARVVAHIDGLAASAATFLIAAADEIVMTVGARMMIHQASTLEIGTSDIFRKTAELLDSIDIDIAQTYAKRTKKPWEDMAEMMRAETWFTAQEALDLGMVDRVFDPDTPVENRWNLEAFDNAPGDFPQAKIKDEGSEGDEDETASHTFDVKADFSALETLVSRMEAAVETFSRNMNKASGDLLEEIADDADPNSTEPVARTVASRARRLRLLERDMA